MMKTFLASTAIATTLGFAALAQTAADPQVTDPATTETQAPADMAPMSPAAPGTEAQTMDPATAPATDTAQDPAAPGNMMAPVAGADEDLTPVASADISADKLIGAQIQTRASEDIAEVEDVLMSADGQVESIVAQFGGFLGFGSNKVLLTPDEIEVLQDASGAFVVHTDLTPEALEGRPDYTAAQ